jgi:uncharacterized protein (DUF433 family)
MCDDVVKRPAYSNGDTGWCLCSHKPARAVDLCIIWQYNLLDAPKVTSVLTQEETPMFAHITSNPEVLSGKPCIKGTRISVEFVLELFASGATHNDLLETYPHLTIEGITEALQYAARFLKNESILVAEVAV